MVHRSRILGRSRFFSTEVGKHHHHRRHKWQVKQVTKSNFTEALQQLKEHIRDSDFVAVSLQKTGYHSSPWHRVVPLDTADTAYFKAKFAAEKFQVLQFAACPFSIRASKVIAHPYNFHIFPRDELRIGMPSYRFSCQSSYLTSMARDGFDFNGCISDGISYLSRAQESDSKDRIGNHVPSKFVVQAPSTPSVADAVFVERMKSRVRLWRDEIQDTSAKNDEALINCLRKLIIKSEKYGSRDCLSIDVCTERQVQLVVEMLSAFSDLVPLVVPTKGGGTQTVKAVLISSKEDGESFERELQGLEEEHSKRVHGFREVIELISASEKPVVVHNSLDDFTLIHSKFLSPLPSTMDEFKCSLRSAFPHTIAVNHLMREIGPLKKATNLPGAISYLKRRFFAPIDMEIRHQADAANNVKIHGNHVLRIVEIFAKLCSILKVTPESHEANNGVLSSVLKGHTNIYDPCLANSLDENEYINPSDEEVSDNSRKVDTRNIIFLWGFRAGMSARMLKELLGNCHEGFSEEFDLHLLDKSCAVVIFWKQGVSRSFLEAMNLGRRCSGSLKDKISDGLRATGYETYKRACRLGLWEADSLDKALEEADSSEASSWDQSEIIKWNDDLMINLEEL